jgi:rhamnogalacturonyl hydrolase YesR
MASMMASVGERIDARDPNAQSRAQISDSIEKLALWLQQNDYCGYDTFDGLNARFLRPLTFETRLLRTILQQGVRRFPWNLRPLLGVRKERSSKGMGFLARGFIRLHESTGNEVWAEKAKVALQWLIDNQLPGYSGACWGNHFDYQSRTFYLPKGTPTVVWTSLIGHAFLDGYAHFNEKSYLDIADSACQHILRDLEVVPDGKGACISYIPGKKSLVHNANTLGASLLARTYKFTGKLEYAGLAEKAIQYTAQHQRPDASWYYGEREDLRWVDNFHTGYVLDCFRHYIQSTGDDRFTQKMLAGYEYWKETFFLADGTPKYYNHKVQPIDIQCCSQAIDTFVFFKDCDPEALVYAGRVAKWTLENMRDRTGYFYYRRYSKWVVNKTPTLHWGQATMLCALSGLLKALEP